MPGKQQTTTQQQSQTAPWQPAQGALTNILDTVGQYTGQTGLTPGQSNAIGQIEGNANSFSGYTPQINNYVSSLLAGGGALSQAPAVQAAYDQFNKNTSPLANNTNYNPYNTPGFSDAIGTLTNQITNNVNGSFAAAGRDGSPANSQALAYGITQGVAPVIASQYNQNVANQQGAASNLYQAGTGNAGILSGLQQQFLENQGNGVNAIPTGLQAANAGSATDLLAESQRLGIPIQNLGSIANIVGGIGGLGSQSSGSGTSQTQTPWYSGVGALGGGTGITNLLSFL